MERAVHRLEPIFLVLDARRGVHRIGVIALVAACNPELTFRDVRRENKTVASAFEFFLEQPLHLVTDNAAFWVPEDETLAVFVADRKEVELAAELAVIAFLGLLALEYPCV